MQRSRFLSRVILHFFSQTAVVISEPGDSAFFLSLNYDMPQAHLILIFTTTCHKSQKQLKLAITEPERTNMRLGGQEQVNPAKSAIEETTIPMLRSQGSSGTCKRQGCVAWMSTPLTSWLALSATTVFPKQRLPTTFAGQDWNISGQVGVYVLYF